MAVQEEPTDDAEEIDLPPLDADEDDIEREGAHEDLIAHLDDDGEPLDDTVAADLDVGADLDDDPVLDEPPGDGSEEDGALDVGALDEGIATGNDESIDDKDEGLDDEDDGIQDPHDDGDDGGTEGTGEPIEDEVDADDLPELDADEDGDYEGEDLLGETLADQVETALPDWDPARWVPREGAGATVPCCAVAVVDGRVVAAGDVVLIVDEGAHAARRASFGSSGGVSIAIAEGAVVVATARGGVLACAPGEPSATPLHGWRPRPCSLELGATTGRLWILADETLWCRTLTHEADARGAVSVGTPHAPGVVRDGRVLAIATDGGLLLALTSGRPSAGPGGAGVGFAIERLRGDDEGWQSVSLEGEALRAAASEGVRLAATAGGKAAAIAARNLVCISRDAGSTFRSVPLPGILAIAFAGETVDADLLAVVARESDDMASLVRVPCVGEPTRLAAIAPAGPPGTDGLGSAAIAWDGARELCWIACRAGLLAFGRARKH